MANNMQVVPSTKKIEAQIVEMMVPLYSYGCEKKIKKALSHLRGIHSVNVEYERQKVTVWGICDRDVVLATVKKKRRESRFWNEELELETGVQTTEEEEEEEMADSMEEEGSPEEKRFGTKPKSRRRMWKRLFLY